MGVVLRAHPVRGEWHIQRNANGEVATPFLFYTRHTILSRFTLYVTKIIVTRTKPQIEAMSSLNLLVWI